MNGPGPEVSIVSLSTDANFQYFLFHLEVSAFQHQRSAYEEEDSCHLA